MMKIILLRHGKPDLPKWDKIKTSDMTAWVKDYNNAGIMDTPSKSLQTNLQNEKPFVICSALTRSQHSAQKLEFSEANLISPIFNEAELPSFHIPLLTFTPHKWSMIFRVLWFAGLSPQAESRSKFQQRISLAGIVLMQEAKRHECVLLVGHGILNRFLAKYLIAKGWQGEDAPNGNKYHSFQYWEFSIFSKSKHPH